MNDNFWTPIMRFVGCKQCPNCKRPFIPMTIGIGEYCPDCWRAFGKADNSFESRERVNLVLAAC